MTIFENVQVCHKKTSRDLTKDLQAECWKSHG